jgi:hypothetical protein
MMYVVQLEKTSVAFPWRQLLKNGKAKVATSGGTVEVEVKNFLPAASRKEDNTPLNGYFSYWFSWYAVNGMNGKVWYP